MKPDEIDVDELVEQADEQPDADAADDGDYTKGSTPMDYDCHRCGTPLASNWTLSAPGRHERIGLCPACRQDAVGSAAFVTHDPSNLTDRQIDDLERRQRTAGGQSVSAAAAFIDADMPPGDYEVRRVAPKKLRVTADDAVSAVDVRRLAQRYVGGPWDVTHIDTDSGVIELLDVALDPDRDGSTPDN